MARMSGIASGDESRGKTLAVVGNQLSNKMMVKSVVVAVYRLF